MPPTHKRRASLSALALLLACGCAVGEPVVDRAPVVEPPGELVPDCLKPSILCSLPLPEPETAVTSRALTGPFCVDVDQGGSAIGGDALVFCGEPAVSDSWRNRDVLVSADQPREVVIAGASVFNVRIRLEGPVTLVLRDLTKLTNVELVTSSPEAAVVFDNLMGLQVTVGDETTPFAGHVSARHSRFDRMSMVATSVELDSAMIRESFVAADFLNSGDGTFWNVVLDLGDALFAPSEIEQAKIVRCRSLAFFGGKLVLGLVPRCESDEPTRFYNTDVSFSILDGLVVGDGATFFGTQLGRFDPSEFVLWRVAVIDKSMFCDQAISLRSTDNIRCSDCTEGAFGMPDDDTCNLEPPVEGRSETTHNPCEALELRSQCERPIPDRMRPIFDYTP